MTITMEQHDKEDHFAFLGIMLPAALIGAGATTAYAVSETVQENVTLDQLIALDVGALLVILSGVYWMVRAGRACEAEQ